MGLELKLLPFRDDGLSCKRSWTTLKLAKDYDLFDRIKSAPSYNVPGGFDSPALPPEGFLERIHGGPVIDGYGDRLKWVEARHLKVCGIPGPEGAFVAALVDSHRVALYWH